MFKVLSAVKELERQGKDVVHFEIGDPDFSTPKYITDAAITSLEKGETHYQSAIGMREFREVVQDTIERTHGFRPDLEQVLISPGANILIYYAIACLVNPGDEVILPDPGFATYNSAIKFCGAVPVRIPLKEENAFRMNPEDVKKAITPKTRLIIMNSPQNPTGSVMTEAEVGRMAQIAAEADVYLYSDEIYARMIFADTATFSSPAVLDKCKERTIIADGVSKTYAMTGWRIGYAVGPADVIAKMALLLETTSSCVTPFLQRAGMAALTGGMDSVKEMMAEYKARRDMLVEGLNNIPGITCLKPGGSFYVFPNITKTGLTSDQFAEKMLQANVALLPGNNFGPSGTGYVRLCYATSRERITEGLRRIAQALKEN